jgi:hypothetical protein
MPPAAPPHEKDSDYFTSEKSVRLLTMNAALQANEGDLVGALESCRAALNATRSIGDEPNWWAQFERISCGSRVVSSLERILAQGTPPKAALLTMQKLLEEEAEVNHLLIFSRCERADKDLYLRKVRDGRESTSHIENLEKLQNAKKQNDPKPRAKRGLEKSLPRREKWYAPEHINTFRAAWLTYLTKYVEICKGPQEEQLQAFTELRDTLKDLPEYLQYIAVTADHTARMCWRKQAAFRCAAVALAVERFRQANGTWPGSLAVLVPEYLPAIPTDPFDGNPLRYRIGDNDVVISSVGLNRDEDERFRRRDDLDDIRDVSFRLWKPALRRQQPLPVRPLDQLGKPEAEEKQ